MLRLAGRASSCEVITRSDRYPIPERNVYTGECSVTWLLSHMKEERDVSVRLDRNDSACLTPRRNPLVNDALDFLSGYSSFCRDRLPRLFEFAQVGVQGAG